MIFVICAHIFVLFSLSLAVLLELFTSWTVHTIRRHMWMFCVSVFGVGFGFYISSNLDDVEHVLSQFCFGKRYFRFVVPQNLITAVLGKIHTHERIVNLIFMNAIMVQSFQNSSVSIFTQCLYSIHSTHNKYNDESLNDHTAMYVSLDVLIVIDDTANVLDFNRYLRSYVSMKCVIFIVYFAVSFVITSFSGKLLHLLRKLRQQLVRMLISDRYRFSSNWPRSDLKRKFFPFYRITDQWICLSFCASIRTSANMQTHSNQGTQQHSDGIITDKFWWNHVAI